MSLKTYVTKQVVDHVLEKTPNIPNVPPIANNYINSDNINSINDIIINKNFDNYISNSNNNNSSSFNFNNNKGNNFNNNKGNNFNNNKGNNFNNNKGNNFNNNNGNSFNSNKNNSSSFNNNNDKSNGKSKKNKWNIPAGLTEKEAKTLKIVKKRAHYLDNGFCSICGIRIGLEPIIGFLPVIGDFMGVWLSLTLVKKSREIDLPLFHTCLMFLNIFFDFLLSLTPFLGDFMDFFYKANSRNAIILEEYLTSKTKDKASKIENGSIGIQEEQNN